MVNYLYDAHAHLSPRWMPNYLDIAEKSIKSGLKGIINSAVEFSEYKYTLDLSKQFPQIKTALGIAPQRIEDHKEIKLERFLEEIENRKKDIVAVGEIGLDYYWVKEEVFRNKQKELFERCIKLANKINLPIVIHSREADKDLFPIIENLATTSVILHSFSGNEEFAKRAIDNGWFTSFSTSVCYSKPRQRVVEHIPLENLLIETDSPFLHPTPGKKLKNEPLNVKFAAEKIAEIKNISKEEIILNTSKNCEKLFY